MYNKTIHREQCMLQSTWHALPFRTNGQLLCNHKSSNNVPNRRTTNRTTLPRSNKLASAHTTSTHMPTSVQKRVNTSLQTNNTTPPLHRTSPDILPRTWDQPLLTRRNGIPHGRIDSTSACIRNRDWTSHSDPSRGTNGRSNLLANTALNIKLQVKTGADNVLQDCHLVAQCAHDGLQSCRICVRARRGLGGRCRRKRYRLVEMAGVCRVGAVATC